MGNEFYYIWSKRVSTSYQLNLPVDPKNLKKMQTKYIHNLHATIQILNEQNNSLIKNMQRMNE